MTVQIRTRAEVGDNDRTVELLTRLARSRGWELTVTRRHPRRAPRQPA